MAGENRWGAPKIYEELLKLGYGDEVSLSTVTRYLRRYKSENPDKKKRQSWRTFLRNQIEFIAAIDFFIVPTAGFKFLFCFFVIHHKRREILHINVTEHPTAKWVIQQLREAFPFDKIPKYLIFDRDKIFSKAVRGFIKYSLNIKSKQTSIKSPWQNGVAERWILSARSELLDHVIIRDENHLQRLLKEYVKYYNQDRCHLSVNMDSPFGRPVQPKPSDSAKVITIPRLGGLVHRYEWRDAA